MVQEHVNYLAVLAASVVTMLVGFLWYSKALFGHRWFRIIGQDKLDKATIEKIRQDVKPYFVMVFIGAFMGAAVLARFIVWSHAATLTGGIRSGFLVWLGFALPIVINNALFSGKDKSLMVPMFLLQAGHYFVSLVLTGAILGAWM